MEVMHFNSEKPGYCVVPPALIQSAWDSHQGQLEQLLLMKNFPPFNDCKCYHSPFLWQGDLGLQKVPHGVQLRITSLFRVILLCVLFSHVLGLMVVRRLGLEQKAQLPHDAQTLIC